LDLQRVLDDLGAALRANGIEHALIGGLALAAHGIPRATMDVDFLVAAERAEALDAVMRARGYRSLQLTPDVANYVSDRAKDGRVDVLFARRGYTRAMLARAVERGASRVPVVDAADLIGLKVQSSSNDPRRARLDLADIDRLLDLPEVDLARVREYFSLFEREAQLDDLLRGRRR